MATAKFPLEWPEGYARTQIGDELHHLGTGGGYRPDWNGVLRRLYRELDLMGAEGVVLTTNQPLRKDGLPYRNPGPIHDPGAAVYFTHEGKSVVMAQDRYIDLMDNIRSLCLVIEGLRQVQRHGGGVMMERAFSGFKQLAPPNHRPWREVLEIPLSQSGPIDLTTLKRFYRRASARAHPDKGGSVEWQQAVNSAYNEAKLELGA